MSFTKPRPEPTPLPRKPRLKTPVPACALQQCTEAIDLELGAASAMLDAELHSSIETALQQLNPQKPDSNIKADLAHVGTDAGLVETHSNTLQNILEQLHPIANLEEHIVIHSRRQCEVLQDEIKARQEGLMQTTQIAQSPTYSSETA